MSNNSPVCAYCTLKKYALLQEITHFFLNYFFRSFSIYNNYNNYSSKWQCLLKIFSKKILKKIRTWLTSLHYTRAKQKKILSKKKNRENAAKTISPPNHKKMVSTLCLPLPYYLWKRVACNQLHSVSFLWISIRFL